jgi:hypothetical protein
MFQLICGNENQTLYMALAAIYTHNTLLTMDLSLRGFPNLCANENQFVWGVTFL